MIDDDGIRGSGFSHKNIFAVFTCIVHFGLYIRDIEMKNSANHFCRFISPKKKAATRIAVSNMPAIGRVYCRMLRTTSNMIRLSEILSRILSYIWEYVFRLNDFSAATKKDARNHQHLNQKAPCVRIVYILNCLYREVYRQLTLRIMFIFLNFIASLLARCLNAEYGCSTV